MELGSPLYVRVLIFHVGGVGWIKWRRFHFGLSNVIGLGLVILTHQIVIPKLTEG